PPAAAPTPPGCATGTATGHGPACRRLPCARNAVRGNRPSCRTDDRIVRPPPSRHLAPCSAAALALAGLVLPGSYLVGVTILLAPVLRTAMAFLLFTGGIVFLYVAFLLRLGHTCSPVGRKGKPAVAQCICPGHSPANPMPAGAWRALCCGDPPPVRTGQSTIEEQR